MIYLELETLEGLKYAVWALTIAQFKFDFKKFAPQTSHSEDYPSAQVL